MILFRLWAGFLQSWIPTFAGMTEKEESTLASRTKALSGFILLFFTPIFFTMPVAAHSFPVQWTNAARLSKLPKDVSVILIKIPKDFSMPIDEKKTETVTACSRYLELLQQNYAPTNTMEIDAGSYFHVACGLKVYQQLAQPAQVSYVRDFDLEKNWGQLPFEVAFFPLDEGKQPSGPVATACPDTKLIKTDPAKNTIVIRSIQYDEQSYITLYGWGDFNHDGYDDILLEVATYTLHGTFRTFIFYVLTRLDPKAPFSVVKLPQLDYLN